MSDSQCAICLVIDRLSAAYVGALGNSWIHTPAFDRLAARSLTFDRAMIDSPAVDQTYRGFWLGEASCLGTANRAAKNVSSPDLFRQQGVPTVLLTDDAQIAGNELVSTFDEVVHVSRSDQRKQAEDWQDTQMAAFFAAAIDWLNSRKPAGLVWLHTGALGRIWDSPQGLREKYADDDDPTVPAVIEPPSLELQSESDPDLLLGFRQCYAGEVSVLDECLATLLDTIDSGPWREALLCVLSSRGYPLGEHGIVGSAAEALYGELLHIPWFVQVRGLPKFGRRSQALVQPLDLYATMRELLALEPVTANPDTQSMFIGRSLINVDELSMSPRKLAVARSSSGEIALATPAWFVRVSNRSEAERSAPLHRDIHKESSARRLELFVKPDDYFEANEVSDRCSGIADEFQQIVRWVEDAAHGVPPDFALSEAIIHGLESVRFMSD